MLRNEANARVHLTASIAVAGAAAAFGLSVSEWRWVVLAMALVWSAEAFNTALERLCDVVRLESDPRIKAVKDLAAGAVLIAASAAAAIGLTTFLPHLAALWRVPPG